MKKAYHKPPTIDRARTLRVTRPSVQTRLWHHLRARQLEGYKFRRQHPVGNYFLDFACEELKLAIELDGGQHNDPAHQRYDATRTAALKQSGWRLLRFWNNEVMENIEGVLQVIQQALTQNPKTDFDLSRWER